MSFQGDVRGIGLAELLQGLARGRKEGVLSLTSQSGVHCNLGMEEGKIVLLPEPDEDPERWRARVREAWADDPARRVDHLCMAEVARAQRLENAYVLLDGGGVHFRFEPGPLPDRGEPAEGAEGHGDSIPVEFLLLEYARISDELEGAPEVASLPSDTVPCIFDLGAAAGANADFLQQCNGTSTLQEIADRMGKPIRQTRLSLVSLLKSGAMRLAHPNEIMGFALQELSKKNFARAATRLAAWCRDGQPGPVPLEVAEHLANEWLAARLTAALQAMPAAARRTLLRRLDHTLGNASQSVVHWLEASRIDKSDRLSRMKRMAAEFKEGSDPERPGVRELLDLAREFRDESRPWRGAPLLVMAAHLQPANMTLQLELGMGLLAAGRPQEGAPWILTGCRELLEQGHADRAVAPLRTLLDKDPRNRECRQLLSRARRQSTTVRKLRKNLLVGLAGALLLSAAAVVKIKRDVAYGNRLDEVRALLLTPVEARRLYQSYFPEDESAEALTLKSQIENRERLSEIKLRLEWMDIYHDAQLESSKGDPVIALEKIRALPTPPSFRLVQEPWPLKKDLYQGLVEHLLLELELLGEPVIGSPQQVSREENVDRQVQLLLATVLENGKPDPAEELFAAGLAGTREVVAARIASRQAQIDEQIRSENLAKQDSYFREYEFYMRNGDFPRAIQRLRDILALDQDDRVRPVLEDRVREAEGKDAAVKEARRLALDGKHSQAFETLSAVFQDPGVFILPWHVESFPSGVRVQQGKIRVYTTPFDIETTIGERVTLLFESPGFEPRALTVDRPGDLFVYLSRQAERHWQGSGRIDAIPVSVDADHIVVDRRGALARIAPGGEVVWEQEIKTLSGIARAPVFLPQRPGHLLLVTEDGSAWIVDSATGNLEGPWELGSAPMVGPLPHASHVAVNLSDGRRVLWRSNLKPVMEEIDPGSAMGDGSYRYGSSSGFQVARRRSGDEDRLECQWNDWVVEAKADAFLVHRTGHEEQSYSVLRFGQWEYLAWESASGLAPQGRLWVSDEAGVRSYVPLAPEGK